MKDLVKLDANENPYGPIDEIRESLTSQSYLHIYPDPHQTNLRNKLTDFLSKYNRTKYKLKKENFVCGTGSDELLEVILKLVLPEEVFNCLPTFGMYDFLGKLAKAEVVNVPRINEPFFEVDVENLLKKLDSPTSKVLYLASPNNPTGGSMSIKNIERVCSTNAFVVIDQAYAEFDFEASNEVFGLLERFPNLLILRTFSKWAGLAGARVGYAVAHPKVVEKLINIKQPYNVTVPSEILVSAALDHHEKIFTTQVQKMKEEKLRMIVLLQEFEWLNPVPSKSNFVLFKVSDYVSASKVYLELRKMGVLIRYYSSGVLKDYIRISAGRPCDTDRLIPAIRVLEKSGKINFGENSKVLEKRVFNGVIFDMDGVLAEVSKSYRKAIEETCKAFGYSVEQEEITKAKIKGNSNNDWILTHELIKTKGGSSVTLEQVTQKFQHFYLGGLRDLETLIPSRALLIELRRRATLGFAIVTGRPREECINFLETHRLTGLFTSIDGDVLCVCMNETEPKPSPEPVLKALKLLKATEQDSVVMLGDTPDDVSAAIAAGIEAFGVRLPGEEEHNPMVLKMIELGATRVLEPGFSSLLEYLSCPIENLSLPNTSSFHGQSVSFNGQRSATISRKTKETEITCSVSLDGTGKYEVCTGIGFLDHMLSAFSKHSFIDLKVSCKGDLWIDDHHTAEDVGITVGETIDKALGSRKYIKRWGNAFCPLDEALCRSVVDISSRPHAEVTLGFTREKVGDLSTEMITHVLQSIITAARLTVHVECISGVNNHHIAESAFKAFGVALRQAISKDHKAGIPSTKDFLA